MILQRYMHRLERQLYQRDYHRRLVRPFDWGMEFLGNGDGSHNPIQFLDQFNAAVIRDSEEFFTPPPCRPDDFEFDGFWLRFPSPIETSYLKNNLVHARYFPAARDDRAVIVLPQWNGDEQAHVGLCRALSRFGISALRLSLPYHDRRMPEELTRADYMVSSNIGRTILSVRQSVQDVRRAIDWLTYRGIERIGIMGTSVGSCVAWITFTHEPRFSGGVFNHVSSYFGDVVWQGMTTAHIRRTLEQHITCEQARQAWLTISPKVYVPRMKQDPRSVLAICALYDLSFPPDLSREFLKDCEAEGVRLKKVFLRCGHYTSGRVPFSYLIGYQIVNYFRNVWR